MHQRRLSVIFNQIDILLIIVFFYISFVLLFVKTAVTWQYIGLLKLEPALTETIKAFDTGNVAKENSGVANILQGLTPSGRFIRR